MRSIGSGTLMTQRIGIITTLFCVIIIAMAKRKGSSDAGTDAKRQCLDLAGMSGITNTGLEQVTHALSVIYGDTGTSKLTQSSIARAWLKEYDLYGRTLDLELETEDGESNGTFKWHTATLLCL